MLDLGEIVSVVASLNTFPYLMDHKIQHDHRTQHSICDESSLDTFIIVTYPKIVDICDV